MSEDRKEIDKICDILLEKGKEIIQFQDYSYHRPVMEAVRIALDKLVVEPETQYQIGSTVALEVLRRRVANDDNALWSIKRAINVLVKFFNYNIGGSDHIECCEKPVVQRVIEVLTDLIGIDSELKYNVAVKAVDSTWFNYILKDWIIDMLKGIQEDDTFYKPACKLMEKLT